MWVFALLAGLIGTLAAFWIAAPLLKAEKGLPKQAVITAAVIALVSLGIYTIGAAPSQPGQPYGSRIEAILEADLSTLTLPEQEEVLRYRIRQTPDNIDNHLNLGRLLAGTDRVLEAVAVLERAVAIDPGPRTYSDLGQALVSLNEGAVTDDAERAFRLAYEADPAQPEAAFFLGLAHYQDGDRATATEFWTQIISRQDEADPLRSAMIARSADLLSRPNVDSDTVSNAGDGPPPIERMISGLEARLAEKPDDFSGWLVLARTQATLGDLSSAADALERADDLFGDRPGHRSIITALAGYIASRNTPETEATGEN